MSDLLEQYEDDELEPAPDAEHDLELPEEVKPRRGTRNRNRSSST